MSERTSRRQFIKSAAAGAIGLPLLSRLSGVTIAKQAGGLQPAATRLNIVVLGAGLAGLSAAFELRKAGHNVTILEARKSAGGRVRTMRGLFSDGLYAEAGALSFPPSHQFTYGYATQFNLPLRYAFLPGLDEMADLNGNVFRISGTGPTDVPLRLSSSEQQAGIFGLIPLYLGQYMTNVGNPRKAGWPSANLAQLDQISCKQLLLNLGASNAAIDIIQASELGILGFGLDSISALDAVFTEAITADGPFLEIAGGNDQLPGAFKSRLKRFLRKQAVVQSIDQSGESVTVTYRQFGAVQTISADRVVCALPFPVLNNIPVNPPFSDAKQQAVSGLKLTPVTRTYLQFSSRSWQQSNLDGSSITDLEIQNTYSPTETQADPRGILTSYAGGQNALSLASLTESNRQSLVLKQMSNMFGGLGQPELGTSVIWQDDPLSQGAFTYFQPGQMTTLLPAAQQPEGRIHFAGEHTSAWHGWMNGALESGNRVAAEINAAANSRVITIRTEPAG